MTTLKSVNLPSIRQDTTDAGNVIVTYGGHDRSELKTAEIGSKIEYGIEALTLLRAICRASGVVTYGDLLAASQAFKDSLAAVKKDVYE